MRNTEQGKNESMCVKEKHTCKTCYCAAKTVLELLNDCNAVVSGMHGLADLVKKHKLVVFSNCAVFGSYEKKGGRGGLQ